MGEMTKLLLLVVAVAISLAEYAHAQPPQRQSPLEEFNDDSVLGGASSEIGSMPYGQLHALKHVFAQCSDDLSNNEILQHYCTVASMDYEMEFGSSSKLDDLLADVRIIRAKLRSDEGPMRLHPEDVKILQRLVDVNFRLRAAINARFKELRAKGIPSQQ